MSPMRTRFILIETSHPGNVGAAARALNKTRPLDALAKAANKRNFIFAVVFGDFCVGSHVRSTIPQGGLLVQRPEAAGSGQRRWMLVAYAAAAGATSISPGRTRARPPRPFTAAGGGAGPGPQPQGASQDGSDNIKDADFTVQNDKK